MRWKTTKLAVVIGIATSLAAGSWAADDPKVNVDTIRDDAISKLAAWRPKSAETTLNKDLTFDKTQPWLTAQGLFMATWGIGQDDEILAQGLAILDKQAKRDPSDPVSEYYRGEVLYWTKETAKAKVAWKNANDRAAARVAKDPKDGCALFYLGASFNRMVQPEEARQALKKAQKTNFDHPMIDYQIGFSYFMEKNWKAAKESFDAVFDLDPRYAYLFFYRALAWESLGRKDNYLIDLDQFIRLAPNSPEAKTAQALLAARK